MQSVFLCTSFTLSTVFIAFPQQLTAVQQLNVVQQFNAVQLPSYQAGGGHAHEVAAIDSSGKADHSQMQKWWVQVEDRIFHNPPSFLGLSQNISDYYYLVGSSSALTDEMKKQRVGGAGRWHIMHLPEGSAMLERSNAVVSGDRRTGFSALKQLKRGQVLSTPFPAYNMNPNYVHPLSKSGKETEMKAGKTVTPDSVMNFLQAITSFPTRSYVNEQFSIRVERYLENEFKKMGYITCLQKWHDDGKHLANVVAHVPGWGDDSMTIAAHFDSQPYIGKSPGAEDNGSGVATMLAIAKAFKQNIHTKPRRNVYFVAFSAQEPGLMGSKRFASFLTDGDSQMPDQCSHTSSFLQVGSRKTQADHAVVILDEVGWVSPKYEQQTVNLESYDSSKVLMDHLRHAAAMHNGKKLAVQHNNAPFGSDHMSFLEKNMTAVLVINADDEGYPYYHQASDTIDNVSPQFMSRIGAMGLGALIRMTA